MRDALVLFIKALKSLLRPYEVIIKKQDTNSRVRQPIKEFRVFLRVLRVCMNEGLRVDEGFEGS